MNVLYEWTVLLTLLAHGDPFGITDECTPALLAVSHAVPGKHVGELLVAFADERRPEASLANAMLFPNLDCVVLKAGNQRW